MCEALWAEAQREADSRLVVGEVDGMEVEGAEESGGRVAGVRLSDGQTVSADAIVLAMGPWTGDAGSWTKPRSLRPALPRTYGVKYHSVVLQAARTLSQAVFFDGAGDPEVYPRPDGSVYVTGFPDPPAAVGEVAGRVEVRADAIRRLRDAAAAVSTELGSAAVLAEQACHLPCTPDGVPAIGAVAGARGLYVATGHSCWGILMAPATGKAMSELLVDGEAKCVDLAPFDPARFSR